jgi:NADH-quinone oxidoreductase subunit N
MSGRDILLAMLPEHLLLLGIVSLIVLDIAGLARRGSGQIASWVALATVAAAVWAAAQLSLGAYAAAPFAGHFSVEPVTLMAKALVLALALPVLLPLLMPHYQSNPDLYPYA